MTIDNGSFMGYIRLRINLINGLKEGICINSTQAIFPLTYEDIKRNTEIIINRKPEPFLVEYGMELSPWITIPIHKNTLHKFVEE